MPVGTEVVLGNIIDTLKRAWKRADLITTTGRLGRTQDYIAREAIGELVNEEVKIAENSWQGSTGLLKRYAGEMPQSNMKQATIIPSAQVFPNGMGTAPRWWVERGDHAIMALSGPPDEMKQRRVQPALFDVGREVLLKEV